MDGGAKERQVMVRGGSVLVDQSECRHRRGHVLLARTCSAFFPSSDSILRRKIVGPSLMYGSMSLRVSETSSRSGSAYRVSRSCSRGRANVTRRRSIIPDNIVLTKIHQKIATGILD